MAFEAIFLSQSKAETQRVEINEVTGIVVDSSTQGTQRAWCRTS